jgi:mono/diheme cytochrome c family protein
MIIVFLLVAVTGHLGGSLTHGTDYFAEVFNENPQEASKPIPNVQEAVAYNDIVQPILKKKCYSCHGRSRQKGGLRMDIPEQMLKGGEDGIILHPGNAEESELIKRLNLPREHEDHMPPKQKSQLNDHEVALLHWWIASGASFDKKVKELEQPEKVKPLLTALEAPPEQKSIPDIPEDEVSKADPKAIDQLANRGVVVLPVSQSSNYLMANFVTSGSVNNADVDLLLPIQKQLVWLKLADANIGDSAMNTIAKCTNLMRLQLDGTRVTNKGIAQLKSLRKLRYLNVVGTKVTAEGIIALKGIPINSLYVYQSVIQKSDLEKLKQAFPDATIDFGGYQVPTLPSDTSLVKRSVE